MTTFAPNRTVWSKLAAVAAAFVAAVGLSAASASAQEAPYVGIHTFVEANATLPGCQAAALRECQKIFGNCTQSNDGAVEFYDQSNAIIMFCGEITVFSERGAWMSLSYGSNTRPAFDTFYNNQVTGLIQALQQSPAWR